MPNHTITANYGGVTQTFLASSTNGNITIGKAVDSRRPGEAARFPGAGPGGHSHREGNGSVHRRGYSDRFAELLHC